MLDLGFVVLLSWVAVGIGLRILDRLDGRPDTTTDRLSLAVLLGLGAMALGMLVLGELGWLNRRVIALLLAGSAIAGWVRPVQWRRLDWASRIKMRDVVSLALALAVAVGLMGTLLTALAPVTDGDALCYHLQVPKVFLAAGAVGFDPDLHETVYPLVTELLYAVALAVRGPVACRLISWVFGVSVAAGVTALARPSLGSRAWWAGAIALLVPAVSNGMSAPLNDAALAAYGTSAIVAWSRFHQTPSFRRLVLAGVMTGLALGVKYPALVLAGLLTGAVLTSGIAKVGLRRAGVLTAVFVVVTGAVGGPWYLRAFLYTGNPVFPFFRQVFGGAGLDEVLDPMKRPMPVSLVNLLTALVPMTLEPARFDSFSHQLGPLFLLFTPALLLERPPRRVVAIVALGYAFLALCLTQRQSMRFVLIAVGPLAVGVAWLLARWRDRGGQPCRILMAGVLLGLGFESSLAVMRVRHGLPVILGREDEAAYLRRCEPTYRVGRWMAENLPSEARVVGQDHRGYYLPRHYTMELAHRRRTGLGRRRESAQEVLDHFDQEGFTHLMLCPPVPETAVEFDPTLDRLLAPWLARQQPLYREAITDADGVTRQYAIYELAGRAYAGRMTR
jgi:hypothetical protein